MRTVVPAAALTLLTLAGSPAGAAEFSGTTTTVARAFDLHLGVPRLDGIRSYRPVDQVVRLTWDRVGARGAWTIDTTSRARLDLATGRAGAQEDVSVLLAKATWTSPERILRLNLGRQRSVTGVGYSAFDGARLEFPRLRRARFHVFGGMPVDLGGGGWPDEDGHTYGGGARVVFPNRGSFGVDYELRNVNGTTTEETAAADIFLHGGPFSFVGHADYSILLARFGETNVMVEHRAGRHSFRARLMRIEPIFPSNTIFASYVTNASTERRLEYEIRTRRGLRIGAFVATEDFENTRRPELAQADDDIRQEDLDRAAVTFSLRGARSTVHRGEIGWQAGWSGERLGGRYDIDWKLRRAFDLGFGASVHRYENIHGLTTADEQYALRARIGYDHRGRWQLRGLLDQFIGRDRNSLRGTLILAVKLGGARRANPAWGSLADWKWTTDGAREDDESAEDDAREDDG